MIVRILFFVMANRLDRLYQKYNFLFFVVDIVTE